MSYHADTAIIPIPHWRFTKVSFWVFLPSKYIFLLYISSLYIWCFLVTVQMQCIHLLILGVVVIFKLVMSHSLKTWVHDKVIFIYHSVALLNLSINANESHSISRLWNSWWWRISLWALGTQTVERRGYIHCNTVVFSFLLQNSFLLSCLHVLKSTTWGHC